MHTVIKSLSGKHLPCRCSSSHDTGICNLPGRLTTPSCSKSGTFVCCCCSQVSNGNCDQGSKPLTRLPCNQVPCAVSEPGLTLGFAAWGECGVQCGSGFSQRTAYCMNPYGALADLSMCSNYSGGCEIDFCTTCLPSNCFSAEQVE